jgi:hypothetical protein
MNVNFNVLDYILPQTLTPVKLKLWITFLLFINLKCHPEVIPVLKSIINFVNSLPFYTEKCA